MSATILLIEDNDEMRDNIASILKLAKYQVITAENGKVGLEIIEENKPDLIICDIMMPVMDGYEVLHILSRDPETANIPFIFLTAKAEKVDLRQGMNLGADDYITKPFEGLDLLKVVEIRLKKSELLKTSFKNNITDINKFFSNVKQLSDFQKLSGNVNVKTYKKKEYIYMEGQHPNEIYFIISGEVKTFKTNPDGKELITGLHYEGDFIGYVPILKDIPHNESAVVLEEAKVGMIWKQDFLSLLYTNKEMAGKFIKLLSNNLYETEKRLLDLAYQSVRQRVAGTLLSILNQSSPHHKEEHLITISRKDISSIVGTATESLNRTLSDFKDEGLIQLRDEGIKIMDKPKLERLAT